MSCKARFGIAVTPVKEHESQMSAYPSAMRRAWLRWKSLKLPWRKRFLVGLDLQGNTYWEFADKLSADPTRMRRIVHYPPAVHYSEVSSQISPAWHQWLRHTREAPPTLTEQSQDIVRQKNLKILAAQADARWAAKESVLDAPGRERGQPVPAIGVRDPGGHSKSGLNTEPPSKEGVASPIGGGLEDKVAGTPTKLKDMVEPEMEAKQAKNAVNQTQQRTPVHDSGRPEQQVEQIHPQAAEIPKVKDKEDPWKKARGGPSESWQPQAWNPSAATPRK